MNVNKRAIELLSSLNRPFVYGMIHVPSLPGTPLSRLGIAEILSAVKREAAIYAKAKVDGIIVENMNDIPYVKKEKIGPEIVSCMSLACEVVRRELGPQRTSMALGVQILAGANQEAMAVAHATGFDMIRAEGFVFSSVADEGWMDASAGDLLRYQRSIEASEIAVFTDVKKKHSSHAVTSDISIGGVAEAAEFFLADGVIVTGDCTGHQAKPEDVAAVKAASKLPVLVGSGVTTANVGNYLNANGVIVGSQFKKDGKWQNELMLDRVVDFMQKIKSL